MACKVAFKMPWFNAMSASIVVGEAGRLVLAKAIRERLHVRKGTKLKADIVGDKIGTFAPA